MNNPMCTRCLTQVLALTLMVASSLLSPVPALAAPVLVSFTANISGTGSLSGAGPTVSGYFTYDSIGTDSNGNAAIGFYGFSGAPYGFSAQIDNFGTLSSLTSLVQVGDNGIILSNNDTVQLAGNSGVYQVRIDWTGPMATFAGDGLQSTAVLATMNPLFVIRNTSTATYEVIASLSSLSYSVVPVPAAAWLFGSALGVMGWMRRKIAS